MYHIGSLKPNEEILEPAVPRSRRVLAEKFIDFFLI